MKILIVSQYFYPENFKGNDIAEDFVKKGHEVFVLTAKPNYPKGKFYSGYNFFNKRIENWKGVKIIRCPVIPRGSSNFGLMLNYFSFIFFGSIAAIFRIPKNLDIVFVQQLSPVTSALPGVLIKRIRKIPLILWVLDLWPESLIATTSFDNKFALNLLNKIVKHIYRHSDKILISSNGFKKSILERCPKEKEIIYFPNWAEDVFTKYKLHETPKLPEGFNIMFAGNIGEAQDVDSILKAAEQTINHNINWIFIGDGRKKNWLEKQIEKKKLEKVYIYGRYPIILMPSFFSKADVMLVSLKDDFVFRLTAPAKIQAYLASGKVILAMINGEGAEIIKMSNSGLVCDSGKYKELSKNAISLSKQLKKDRKIMEINSRAFYSKNFSKQILLSKLENIITTLVVKK